MTTMNEKELGAWLKRAEVVGRAQERYLWMLLVSGIFFLALDPLPQGSVEPPIIPILSLPLRPDTVWAAGPFVLGFLVVAAMGSFYAFNTVIAALKGTDFGEAIDPAPNALDFVF